MDVKDDLRNNRRVKDGPQRHRLGASSIGLTCDRECCLTEKVVVYEIGLSFLPDMKRKNIENEQ